MSRTDQVTYPGTPTSPQFMSKTPLLDKLQLLLMAIFFIAIIFFLIFRYPKLSDTEKKEFWEDIAEAIDNIEVDDD